MTSTVITTVVWIVNQGVVFNGILKVESLGCHITEVVFVEITATSRIMLYFDIVHETPFFSTFSILFCNVYEWPEKYVQLRGMKSRELTHLCLQQRF